MSYKIGQVLFVVLNKKSQVYPMQVVEIITKKSLQGEDTKYLLQGGSNKTSTVLLDEVDGEIFDSSEKARQVLVKRATFQINKLVDVAITKSKEWYGSEESLSIPSKSDDFSDIVQQLTVGSDEETDDGRPTVVLPDGTVAKISVNIPA